MSLRLLKKLQMYETDAYQYAYGDVWLESVGEGFKFYIRDCVMNNEKPSFQGFEKYLDEKKQMSNEEVKEFNKIYVWDEKLLEYRRKC